MAIAFARSTGLQSASNVGSTTSGSFGTTPGAGSHIEVRVTGWHASNYTATVPTDNQSNTYVQVATETNSNSRTRVYIYHAENIAASGTFTITLNNVQSSGNYINWCATEHTGIAVSGSFDVAATGTSTTPATSLAVTTASTAQADELVVAVIGTAANTPNDGIQDPPTTGYTSRSVYQASDTIIGHESADKIVAATGAQSATWTHNDPAAPGTCGAVATFKAAAAGGQAARSMHQFRLRRAA